MSKVCTCTTYGNCELCRPRTPRREAFKTSAMWQLGQLGERELRRYLEASGKFVVPTTSIEDGGAPVLSRLRERYVLPDFQAFTKGAGEWWEVKTKERPFMYRLRGTLQHGIDEPSWRQYLHVEQETGLPGYLAIVQLVEPALLVQSFRRLSLCVQTMSGRTDAYDGKRLVYWDVDDFERIVDNFDPDRIASNAAPTPTPIPVESAPIAPANICTVCSHPISNAHFYWCETVRITEVGR